LLLKLGASTELFDNFGVLFINEFDVGLEDRSRLLTSFFGGGTRSSDISLFKREFLEDSDRTKELSRVGRSNSEAILGADAPEEIEERRISVVLGAGKITLAVIPKSGAGVGIIGVDEAVMFVG
jgi:hypothetical protein